MRAKEEPKDGTTDPGNEGNGGEGTRGIEAQGNAGAEGPGRHLIQLMAIGFIRDFLTIIIVKDEGIRHRGTPQDRQAQGTRPLQELFGNP